MDRRHSPHFDPEGPIPRLSVLSLRLRIRPCLIMEPPAFSYVFIDTPGQIEVFTWSASGQIITETLASSFPTVSP